MVRSVTNSRVKRTFTTSLFVVVVVVVSASQFFLSISFLFVADHDE